MFGSFLPSLWSLCNQSLLGSRSRHCYAIMWIEAGKVPVSVNREPENWHRREGVEFTPLFLAVRTAWPATRPAHSFLEFRTYPLNVLPSGFRFLDGDNPADPFI